MLNRSAEAGRNKMRNRGQLLSEAGIEVRDSNPAFDVTHEKSMVVDEKTGFIQSLNWVTKNLTETRDYAVVTAHKHEVKEVVEGFEADWERKTFDPGDHAHLIRCIGNGRRRIGQFIDDAKDSLWVQSERYQDPVTIERRVAAKMRGVKVQVLARPPHNLEREKLAEAMGGLRMMDGVGIKAHKLKHLKLHANLLYADRARSLVRSTSPWQF